MTRQGPRASIIIPAHNESKAIGRLLGPLVDGSPAGEFELIVVCNGCTDQTADVAGRYGKSVRVVEIAEPSKQSAMKLGDRMASTYPRLFVDADVETSAASILLLCDRLEAGDGLMAVGPARVMPLRRSSWIVRSYYRVWQELPQVKVGLFGRGIIGVSRAGAERIRALPPLMSDDLAFSEAFDSNERAIVEAAEVTVVPPRTTADLINRRVRVATGTEQAHKSGVLGDSSRTTLRTLAQVGRTNRRIVIHIPSFLCITLVSRFRARRALKKGDFTTWQRDESSRDR